MDPKQQKSHGAYVEELLNTLFELPPDEKKNDEEGDKESEEDSC